VAGAAHAFSIHRCGQKVFDEPEARARFAAQIAAILAPGGLWLSLIGSTEGPAQEVGPPRRSAREVILAIEPALEIQELLRHRVPWPRRQGAVLPGAAKARGRWRVVSCNGSCKWQLRLASNRMPAPRGCPSQLERQRSCRGSFHSLYRQRNLGTSDAGPCGILLPASDQMTFQFSR
jgi:hypothetical protein